MTCVLLVLGAGLGCAHRPASNGDGDTAAKTTTLLLARHAEKVRDAGKDPPLTKVGQHRAQALVEALEGEAVDAIYVTPFRRTRATARPLAEARGLAIREHAPQDAAFLHRLLDTHAGQTVLVIGHRTTIPRLLNAVVEQERYRRLPADAHGQLFVVTIRPGDRPRVQERSFGSIPGAGSPANTPTRATSATDERHAPR